MTSEGALTTATSKPAKMIDRLSSKVGFTQEGSVPQPLGSRPAATGDVPVNHMGSLRRRDRAAGAPHVASAGPFQVNVDSARYLPRVLFSRNGGQTSRQFSKRQYPGRFCKYLRGNTLENAF